MLCDMPVSSCDVLWRRLFACSLACAGGSLAAKARARFAGLKTSPRGKFGTSFSSGLGSGGGGGGGGAGSSLAAGFAKRPGADGSKRGNIA
jgi:hypothetical protein